jgi:hypothetical protein
MMDKIKNAMVVMVVLSVLGGLVYLTINKVGGSEYIYVARGIQCKEYDKDTNTLKQCDESIYGEVEIINPISILKVRLNDAK